MFKTKKEVMQPFEAVLRDMIANPPAGSVKSRITPDMALEMLTFNTSNRPVTTSRVNLYAKEMAEGRWRYTRVPIIFSDAGRVIDGQHRLYACVESGVPIDCDVAFGAPDEAFAFIDVGKTRSAGDIFAINGVPNHNSVAAMTRILVNYFEHGSTEGGGRRVALTPAEAYEAYCNLDRLQDSMKIVNWFGQQRLASPSTMGAMHYVCAQKNRKEADEFFDLACHGGGDRSGPAAALHTRLIRNAASQEKLGTHILAGLTLTAWNRHRSGVGGKGLRFDGGKLPAAR